VRTGIAGLGFAIVMTVAGCNGKQAPSPSADAEMLQASAGKLDDTVKVQLGKSALARDRSVAISYLRLLSESRCPANAICVWQGDAAVQLRAATSVQSVDTAIHTALEPKTLQIGGNTISLLEVQPYPGTGEPKEPPYIVVRVLRTDP
jgi:hypothetical protein